MKLRTALLVISDPKVTSPEAARKLGRPIVFVQANIHAGEVEGKEAVMKLARRLVSGDLRQLTRQLVLLIAPDYNADGNEKVSPMNRTAQNGPVAGVGTRENSKGLDLNRDYMKLDSIEARSLVGLMNKWDPHVVVDPANPGNVTWRTFDHRPRFGNNYVGLRNRIAILSEAYSYLDFKGRIEVTEDFVAEIYKSVAANARQIMTLTAQADRVFTAPAGKPVELGVDIEIRALPEKVSIDVGDVTKVLNPRSGREMLAMAPMAVPVMMKDYGVFAATRSLPMPKGWLIPKALADSPRMAPALERLRWHGIKISQLAAETRLMVERFTVSELTRQPRVFQGHQEARAKGTFDKVQLVVNEGSLFIPASQPLARLAFYLIEPESDDGLVTWNVIDEGLAVGQTYPIYRVTGDGGLKLR